MFNVKDFFSNFYKFIVNRALNSLNLRLKLFNVTLERKMLISKWRMNQKLAHQ